MSLNFPKKILIIGGGHPQLCLIEAVIAEGMQPIIIDNRNNIPAKTIADHIVPIDRYDEKRILDFAQTIRPDYVTSGGADRAVLIMAKVAEALNLPQYVSSAVAKYPMQKEAVQKLLDSHQVNVPKTLSGKVLAAFDLDQSLVYPVVIKPDQGIGQTAVNKAWTKEEARISLQHALLASQNGKAILQEYIEGEEIGVNGIVIDKQFSLLTTSYRRGSRQRGDAFGVALEKLYPAITDSHLLDQIKQLIQKACTVMGITNGPIYAQVIHHPERGFFIVEIMPRLGGGEDPRLVKVATGFDLCRATTLLSMGKCCTVKIPSLDANPSTAVVLRFLTYQEGRVERISGLEQASALPGIHSIRLFFEEGFSIAKLKSSRERAGYILATGKSTAEAAESAHRAEESLVVRIV